MTHVLPPCFIKSKGQRTSNRGLLKNRFEFFGVLDKDYLKIDAGELVMFEGIKYTGQINKDLFHGEGELNLPDGYVLTGIWRNGMLINGRLYLKEINYIDFIEVNMETNIFRLKFNKEIKQHEITNNLSLEFKEKKIEFVILFTFSKLQGINIQIIKKIPHFTLNERCYSIKTTITPLLYYSKEYIIENSRIIFNAFPNYKVEYVLKTVRGESKYNLKRFVVYPNGTCFLGKIDNIEPTQDISHSHNLQMPGIYIDLDEYLVDHKKFFPFYDKFSLMSGHKRNLTQTKKKVKRMEIEKAIFGKLINCISNKLKIIDHIHTEELDRCQMRFQWNNFTDNYFEDTMIIHTNAFDYTKRMSKDFVSEVTEKTLTSFNWKTKTDNYFNFLIFTGEI